MRNNNRRRYQARVRIAYDCPEEPEPGWRVALGILPCIGNDVPSYGADNGPNTFRGRGDAFVAFIGVSLISDPCWLRIGHMRLVDRNTPIGQPSRQDCIGWLGVWLCGWFGKVC